MNGISSLMSKSFCPIYKPGTSNKINLIPRPSSNLHLQNPSLVATTRSLEHCVYSSSADKDATDSRSQVPEVSGTVEAHRLLGHCIMCMALFKACEVLAQFILTSGAIEGIMKSDVHYYVFLGVVAVFVARGFLGKIRFGLSGWEAEIVHGKIFLVGDIIEVGCVKGEVIELGLINTTFSAEKGHIVVPTSWYSEQICVQVDEIIDTIIEMLEEIENMMKCNSNVFLEIKQPYSLLFGWGIGLGCDLKKMCKDELYSAELDILLQSLRIFKKYGATPLQIKSCHL